MADDFLPCSSDGGVFDELFHHLAQLFAFHALYLDVCLEGSFEDDGYKAHLAFPYGFGHVVLSAGVDDALDSGSPFFEKGTHVQELGDEGVIREGVVRFLDSLGCELWGKCAGVGYLDTVVVDGDSDG